ncbi:hypothetical protein EC82524_2847B, partial [Escherichia coli 8.2524]
RGNDGYVQS